MQINGTSHAHGPQSLNGPHRSSSASAAKANKPMHGADQIDISPEAEMVSKVNDLPEVRADRIAEIRQQIESGTYETEAKLDVAVGRLLDEMAG